MSRCTTFVAVLVMLGAGVVALGEVRQNSKCEPHNGFTCVEQGQRLCAQKANCSGTCYGCIGQDTIPPHMCFVTEGSTCTTLAEFPCGFKTEDGACVKVGANCTCETTNTLTSKCTMFSCNPAAQ